MSHVYYGLPPEVKFCTNCVISNQRPNSTVEFKSTNNENKQTIGFSKDGLCEACQFAIEKDVNIDWEQREKNLLEVLDRHRRGDGRHDCIVPGSGGKDSAFTSHILKYKYGMNPLTVTWAPHLYTEIGWDNFQNWCHVGGLDNLLFTPNGRLHRHLTKLAFLNLLHPFQPFIVGQRIIGPSLAAKFDIPLIFYGENQAEYGNPISENSEAKMDNRFFSEVDASNIFLGGQNITEIIKETEFNIGDFAPYIPPKPETLSSKKIEVHYLGFYLKWDPQECFYYAVENTGFKPKPDRTLGSYSKYSSIDDKIDMMHYFTTLIKFGIGRATYDASQEIRNGKITRSEGVHLVRKFDEEFPEDYFQDFLTYIGLDERDFWETCDAFRSPHLWEMQGNQWKLKFQVS